MNPAPPPPSRRHVLQAGGLTAAGLALAACASETEGPQARRTGAAGTPAPRTTFTEPRTKLSGTLSILLWSHFVPSHDKWFDGFVRDWGRRVGVNVRVDHISVNDLPARIAAEMQARQGHDLLQDISTLSRYEPGVTDLSDLVQEADRRWGKQLDLCRRSSFNPNTGKFYAYSPGWSPDPGDYRVSLWQPAGFPNGPETWDDLLKGGSEIKKSKNIQLGLGMSQEIDSNMAARALLWSYGASEQDAQERVVLNSDEAVAAVEFMTRLFKGSMTNEVFSWNASSNNQGLVAGRLSYILNSISAWRTAQGANPKVADDIGFVPALRGPKAALAAQHVMYNWIVPSHAKAIDAAKEFLLHYTANFASVTYHSKLYDLPGWPSLVPQLSGWLDADPFGARPANKLALLKNAVDWSVNIGYPGPANPAVGEVLGTFVIPNMMARAARGEATPKQAVAEADRRIRQIFERWRSRGLVGG
ncbi:ABC transporter substrate-binding protein [Bailinhaonella thermotolerans]|uniref:Extracellular solute-binding protein n=1 Tax=Bailinhaonella thermotolerans TaxID=1070861 RepID=A0A3A4AW67_9ACTN|nr:extracellular solute-binding protein [Bailinhaonella thermotolerans]RJL33113.1 extracellular solute-binding protein [Bailinhaonella thermotolerans]